MVYSRKVIHYAGTRMNLCQKFSKIIFQGPYIFFDFSSFLSRIDNAAQRNEPTKFFGFLLYCFYIINCLQLKRSQKIFYDSSF